MTTVCHPDPELARSAGEGGGNERSHARGGSTPSAFAR